jgi:hypothetical protein
MSGDDAIRELARGVGEAINGHMNLPPRQKNIHRAGMGAWLLAAVIFSVYWSQTFIGWPAATLLTFFLRHGTSAATIVWLPLLAWTIATLLGALWLVVGINGSVGPRDTMNTVWAGVRLCIVAGLLLFKVYLPYGWNVPLINLALQGMYLSYVAACAVELVLLLRGLPGRSLQANTHGQARTASVADLKRSGIIR